MRPIPIGLLPSTMTWYAPKGGRSMAGEFEDEGHEVEHVRLDRSQGSTVRDASVRDHVAGTVYADAANSVGDLPPVGARVVIGGFDGVVRTSQTFYGFGDRVHHTELGVG